jgi:hypothetical protein
MASADIIEVLFQELTAGRVVRMEDRVRLGIAGAPVEEVLDALVRAHDVLLHGTGEVIPSGTPLRLSPGRERGGVRQDREGFATDVADIAILKALFSNIVNLRYPMVLSKISPLTLTIIGWRPEVERPRGYVHLIGPKNSFEREGATWQWVTSKAETNFGGCVEVERADFRYPVLCRPTA